MDNIIKSKEDMASDNFYKGYNCAQSVILAYAEELGLSAEFATKLTSSFGGGMGRLREVCGAVSAMFMLAGLVKGYSEPNNDDVKAEHYELIQLLAKKFQLVHGSIICRELLDIEDNSYSPQPTKRTADYYASRPCDKFIRTATKILDEVVFNES